MLSADRQLANEIEFDLRKFDEEQKELEKQQRERVRNPSNSNVSNFVFRSGRALPYFSSILLK